MIKRLAWRTGTFVGTTAQRALQAAEGLVPGVSPPPRRHRRRLPSLAGVALALAVGFATAGRHDSNGPSKAGYRRRTARSSGTTGRSSSAGRRSAPAARSRAGGKVVDLTDKSREELYQLARDAGISGRSGMNKQQLARALAR
ncbi:MAG TPA: Rho termination factor N-terminal domain-containing protein [Acidimicrobiales bacterium]|nr:Rho termination factor N-terminal domain-containing protein [Acidimicrobiales bacterium]